MVGRCAGKPACKNIATPRAATPRFAGAARPGGDGHYMVRTRLVHKEKSMAWKGFVKESRSYMNYSRRNKKDRLLFWIAFPKAWLRFHRAMVCDWGKQARARLALR